MENWKKLALRAASFGAGFAVVAALLWVWWASRPAKPMPWNTAALTGTYESVGTEGIKNTIVFNYIVENTTDSDYQAVDKRSLHIAVDIVDSNSLMFEGPESLRVDYPIYIPAHTRVRLRLHLNVSYPERISAQGSLDDHHDFDTRLCRYLATSASDFNGFSLLDDNLRYRVNLPNGWVQRAKEPLRAKPKIVRKNPEDDE